MSGRTVVVGGGPAGLAVAIRLATEGREVVVFDAAHAPVDKACGEGLMPEGVAALERLGVRVPQAHPYRGVRWIDGNVVAEGRFPGAPGWGVRRRVLHDAMVARAQEVGVTLRWGVKAHGLRDGVLRTTAGPIAYDVLVGADGLHGPVRRMVGLAGGPAGRRRFGVRRHFRATPWTDCVEVWWGDGGEAYVTPIGPDEVGVAFLWCGEPPRFDALLSRFGALAERLGPPTTPPRGAGPLRLDVRRVVLGRVALVGDASGYVDALTGEGVSLALAQAAALADAVLADDLTLYARAHPRIGRRQRAAMRALLAVEARPWLRRRLIASLAAAPDVFGTLLGIHEGHLPATALGLGGAVRLGWGLLRG